MMARKRPGAEPVTFGEQLRTLRRERKISQTSLSEASGISQTRISELERGETLPGLRDFSLLRQVLPINIETGFEAALRAYETRT